MIPNKRKLPPLPPPAFGLNQQPNLRRPGEPNSVMAGPPMRREKIYCDKWVHEGTCAFTQVGCKYKHEMPMDKSTQVSLGLNHGVPNWYRRQHGLSVSPPSGTNVQVEPSGTTSTSSTPRMSQSWRRKEVVSFSFPTTAQGGVNVRDRRSSFGPIGPPHSRRLTNSSSGDSMNRIALAENEAERERNLKMQLNGRARGYTSGHEQIRGQQ
ncbi:hypothetical protein DID88_000970 [Monilinia fructigena]|uniref:C3H1-type domain-containing protein n=1 Tax=Monilinia fructigena TaxID=38457 RepID=A0A395IYS1_9HELO|nr:hypothetical protein DID88_000970 [Monilinia fructigena]